MNTSAKAKINRLGLVGVIISIILIISAFLNLVLVTNRAIHQFGPDSGGKYRLLEQKALNILIEQKDHAEKVTANGETYYELPFGDGTRFVFYEYGDPDNHVYGELYDIVVPTDDEFVTYRFTVENPEKALVKMQAQQRADVANEILTIISSAFAVVVFVFLLLVANAFRRCDSPFETRVIRRMCVFAWVLFADALFNHLLALSFEIYTRVFYSNVAGYYTESGIAESVLQLVTPSFAFVVSLIVLFLVRVFRHGAALQKESDETL